MDEQKKRKFGLRDKVGYMLGDAGNDFTLMMLQSYLLVFYTKVLGVSGAVIGTMFLVTKFVDAFTDTAMGRIVDSHTDKNGDRFRPWIRRFAIPVVISSILLYNIFIEGWPMWAKIIYVSVVYLVYGSICYTGINIPYGAMAAVISADPKDKTSLSTFRSLGGMIANLVIGIIIPMIVYSKDADGNNIANGPRFLILAIAFGGVALLCYYLCYHWTVERIHIPNKKKEEKAENENLFSAMKRVCCDKAILSVILVSIAYFSGASTMQGLNQYLFLDYFKDTSFIALSNVIMMVGMVISAPIATKISVRFGKKEGGVVGLTMLVVAYIFLFVARIENPMTYILIMFIGYLGMGYFQMINWAMISDCIDNYYVVYGERADGTIYAMYSFLKKLAGAVTGSIGAWTLAGIGYDELAVVQTKAVSNSIYTYSIAIPGLFFLFAVVLLAVMYPLNKATVEHNAEVLRKVADGESDGGIA